MNTPPPPPYAVLIRLVRQAAKISIVAAAKRAGMSEARWQQIEQGYEVRDRVPKPSWAPPDTLAYMADAVGINPDRLETEGERADAAAVLQEMQRHRQRDAHPVPVPVTGDRPRYADPALQRIWELPGPEDGGWTDAQKENMIAFALGMRASAGEPERKRA